MFKRLRKVLERLKKELGREPTLDDVRRALK
jgi:hypothetical protein